MLYSQRVFATEYPHVPQPAAGSQRGQQAPRCAAAHVHGEKVVVKTGPLVRVTALSELTRVLFRVGFPSYKAML
jgi:hypothetical protein